MAKRSTLDKSIKEFIGPKNWLSWLGIGVAFLISFLPWAALQRVGKIFGRFVYLVSPRRRHICNVNFKICFPEMTKAERKQLTKEHFESMGQGTLETFASWFQDKDRFASRVTFEGEETLTDVMSRGKGCILISGHFSSLDICGSQVPNLLEVHPIYQLQSNPVINWVMERQRKALFNKTIERSNMREVLKSLRTNNAVWYAVDQDYGRKNSVFAPFYGRECATIAHIDRIAKMTDAPVVLYDYGRTNNGYHLKFSEVKDFPTADAVENATIINQLMESVIAPKIPQYFWAHRRFKTQKEKGTPSPY